MWEVFDGIFLRFQMTATQKPIVRFQGVGSTLIESPRASMSVAIPRNPTLDLHIPVEDDFALRRA